MKVLGIAGSLRPQSNTLYYVKTALGVLEGQGIQTELISLQGKEIKPCTGCYDLPGRAMHHRGRRF
jgi:multimeric flavodoxin WrbA